MQAAPSEREISRSALATLAVATGIAVGLVVSQLRTAWAHAETNDFSAFYYSSRAWLAGTDLYLTAAPFPNLNPPHFIAAFAPIAYLPVRQALVVWTLINVACAVLGVRLLFRELGIRCTIVNALVAFVISGLCIGVLVAIEAGQLTGILMLVLTSAWSLSRRGRWVACGVLLGAVASIKPFFGCLLLIPLLHRQYKALAATGASVAVALLSALVLCGPESIGRWLETGRLITWFQHPANASLLGLLTRGGIESWVWWGGLSALALLMSIAATLRSDSLDTEWAVYALLSIVISPLGWDYYLPAVAAPLVAVARRHKNIAIAAAGFMWPVPLAIAMAPPNRLSMISLGSLQTLSLMALWISVLATGSEWARGVAVARAHAAGRFARRKSLISHSRA